MNIKISKKANEAKKFSDFILLLRNENGISARTLAKCILKAGREDYMDLHDVDAIMQRIYRWENYDVNPRPWELFCLADSLNVKVSYFAKFFNSPF